MKSSSTGGGFRHMTAVAVAGTLNRAVMAGPVMRNEATWALPRTCSFIAAVNL